MATSKNLEVKLVISADGRVAVQQLNAVGTAVEGVGNSAEQAGDSLAGMKRALKVAASIETLRQFVTALADAGMRAQDLRSRLEFAAGGVEEAQKQLAVLTDTAAANGKGVAEMVDAYIRLKNLGLDPSREALEAYLNVAAASGKSLQQFVEAVADATTGEFERLKEFGIKMGVEGDKLALRFRGSTTLIENNAKAIEEALQNIGEKEFAGAVEAQSKNASVALSTMGDAIDRLAAKLAEDAGLNQGIAASANGITALANALAQPGTPNSLAAAIEQVWDNAQLLTNPLGSLVKNFGSVGTAVGTGAETLADWVTAAKTATDTGQALATETQAVADAQTGAAAAAGAHTEQQRMLAEQMADVTQESAGQSAILAKFDALAKKGDTAAKSIGTLVSALRFDSTDDAVAGVASVADLIAQLGTANEAAGEKVRATARDISEGLGPALDKLSGESLKNFAEQWATTLAAMSGEPVATTAAVMDTILGAALRKLSLDLDELRTGTTEAGRSLTASFQAVAIAAAGDFEIVYAAWQKVLGGLKSVQDAEAARQSLVDLGASGRLSLADLTVLTGELNTALNRLKATTGETADAFARLGVTSQAELKTIAAQALADFETIRTSGTATSADIAAAYEAYAQRAVAAGDAITLAEARQAAYRTGQVATLDRLLELTKTQAAAANEAADATERQATAANSAADATARQTSASSSGSGGGGSDSSSRSVRTVTVSAPSEQTGVYKGGGLASARGTSAAMAAEIAAADQLLADAQTRWASQPLVIPFTLSDRTENAIATAALAQGARI